MSGFSSACSFLSLKEGCGQPAVSSTNAPLPDGLPRMHDANSICDWNRQILSWGGLQKHGVKNKFEFLTFFETRQKGRNVNGCLPQPLYWISPMLGQGGARLAKNMQEQGFIDVPRPGNMLAVRGGYTRMRPCRQCHGDGSHESQTPPHPRKGCRLPGPKKVKNSVKFFFALKSGSACGPSNVFFSQKFFAHFSLCCQRFFCRFFTIFSHIFSHYFSHGFSRRIFRTSLLRIFLTHFFIAVCYPECCHSLQSQHCGSVPKTSHTTTCRSSPSLLTQYSHKQVENFQSFWKDKRQIFTLQTIRHNRYRSPEALWTRSPQKVTLTAPQITFGDLFF